MSSAPLKYEIRYTLKHPKTNDIIEESSLQYSDFDEARETLYLLEAMWPEGNFDLVTCGD